MAAVTSAAGLLALLEEEDDSLKLYALQQLDRTVHDFWFQISTSIAAIEALYEDEEFSHRELAALVASKVRAGRGGGRVAARARRSSMRSPSWQPICVWHGLGAACGVYLYSARDAE